MIRRKVILSIAILALIGALAMYEVNKDVLYQSKGIYNSNDGRIAVNDDVIIILNYTYDIDIISKETALKMDLGVEMEYVFPDYADMSVSLDEEGVIWTGITNSYIDQIFFDTKSYKEKRVSKKRSFIRKESTPSLTGEHLDKFGGNYQYYANDFYHYNDYNLFVRGHKVSDDDYYKPGFHAIDNGVIYYVNMNFDLVEYNKGKKRVLAHNVLDVKLTESYIYCLSKTSDKVVRINRDNVNVSTELIEGAIVQVKDKDNYTYFLQNDRLIVLKDDAFLLSFDDVERFDIDDSDIYTFYKGRVDKISMKTFEREEFWDETGN